MLVTATDCGLRLYNGDTGVTVQRYGALRAVIAGAEEPLEFATSRLSDVETVHAITIHKNQGSRTEEVRVLLPPVESRLLTRELLCTAVTRSKAKVRLIGSEAEVRAAIDRRGPRDGPPAEAEGGFAVSGGMVRIIVMNSVSARSGQGKTRLSSQP